MNILKIAGFLLLIMALIALLIFVLYACSCDHDKNERKDLIEHCTICDGKFKFISVTVAYGQPKTYYYECQKCHKVFEFNMPEDYAYDIILPLMEE